MDPNQQQAPIQGQPAAAGQKDDYVDKAFAAVSKKTGHTQSKETSEKITDGLRKIYEKITGKKVNPKISN